MKTAHKFLILASSVVFFPIIAIVINLGIPTGIVLFTLTTYTVLIINLLTK